MNRGSGDRLIQPDAGGELGGELVERLAGARVERAPALGTTHQQQRRRNRRERRQHKRRHHAP